MSKKPPSMFAYLPRPPNIQVATLLYQPHNPPYTDPNPTLHQTSKIPYTNPLTYLTLSPNQPLINPKPTLILAQDITYMARYPPQKGRSSRYRPMSWNPCPCAEEEPEKQQYFDAVLAKRTPFGLVRLAGPGPRVHLYL